jgi:hypothetical protein
VRYGWAERFSRSGNSPEAARRAEGLSDGPCSQSNPASSSNLGLGNEAKGTFPCLPLTDWNSTYSNDGKRVSHLHLIISQPILKELKV